MLSRIEELLAQGNAPPDRTGAEEALIELVGAARAVREPLGDDALWTAAA